MRTQTLDAGVSTLRASLSPALSRLSLRSHAVQLALVFGIALVLRLAWVAYTGWQPTFDDDAYRYDHLARGLASGDGYVHLNGAPTAFWPPGYPLLLAGSYAVFGESVHVAQLLNVALSTGTIVLVYLLGRRLLTATAGLVAAAIVALFPSLVFFTGVTLSESAFTTLALLAAYLLVVEAQSGRRDLRLLLGAGLVLGFASLVRGQALLLPLVLVPFWLLLGFGRGAITERIVALVLGMGLIVAPWTVRNAIEMDAPVLIATNAGIDFWIGHHESASGDFGTEGGDPLVYRHPGITTVEREVRVNGEGFREGLEYAVTHPAQELVLPLKKLFWLYYNDEEGIKWNEGHGGQSFLSDGARSTLTALSNVYYFAVLGLFAASVRLWRRSPGRVLLVSLIAYWTLVHLVFFGDPRFHAPIMPVFALLAALTITELRAGRMPWAAPKGSN